MNSTDVKGKRSFVLLNRTKPRSIVHKIGFTILNIPMVLKWPSVEFSYGLRTSKQRTIHNGQKLKKKPMLQAINKPLRRNILVKIDGHFNNVENVYVATILENCPLISPARL